MAKSALLYNFTVTNLSQFLQFVWIRTCDILDEVLYNACHYPLTWVHYFTFTIFFLLILMPLVRGESARYRYLWLVVVLVLYMHLLGGGYGSFGTV
jgi:predicted branched-subunit amino acid permease